MFVYRLTRAKWADTLSGEGAKLYGGRWNHRGIPCIYTSESRALAVLEYAVHTDIEEIPRDLCIMKIQLPDEISRIPIAELPGNWQYKPAPESTREFGKKLFISGNGFIFQLPSVIIPQESVLIINPLHPAFKKCRIIEAEDFVFDLRVK